MSLGLRGKGRIRLGVIYVLCAVVLVWALAPIYWVAVSSISTRRELYAQPYKIWFPSEPTFESYHTIFTQGAKFRDGSFSSTAHLMRAGLRNSLIISGASAAIVTLLATCAGYAFARMQFRGKNVIFLLIMLMLPLPIWVSLIALFFIMSRLELVDTLLGLVLIFVTLLLPLARPGMVAVFLVAMLTTWNNFLIPLIFSRTDDSQPLTIVFTLFIGQYEVAWEDMSAAAVVTMLPPFLMALFFQRYLVRGLTMGAVK